MRVPISNLLSSEEGHGFYQLMEKLPQERLIVAIQAIAMIEQTLAVTIDVKQRKDRSRLHTPAQNRTSV